MTAVVATQDRRLIALDIMDTLLYDPWREALEAATGRPCAELARQWDAGVWQAFEAGEIGEAEYWSGFRRRGIAVDTAAFHGTRRRGYRWLPGAQALLDDLRTTDHAVALATNYPHWAEEVREEWFAELDLPFHASYALGIRKPEPDYFRRVLARHGMAETHLVLIDDSAANCEAVSRLGGIGLQCRSIAGVRQQLTELAILA